MDNQALKNLQAILWVTASVGLCSLLFASGKFLGRDSSAIQILFLRYVGGVLVLSVICLLQPTNKRVIILQSKRVFSHFIRAIFGSLGGVCIIYASTRMPVVDAAAIGLLNTVFLILFGVILLKEHISRLQALAIIICFLGAASLVLAKGAFHSTGWIYLIPILVAILSAIFIAAELIMIKQLTDTESPLTMLVIVNIFGAMLLAIPALLQWQTIGLTELLGCLLLGPMVVLAQYFTVRGYQLADVIVVGPVNYTWLIFAALLGWYFFDEMPTTGTLIGGGMIVVGGIMLGLLPSGRNEEQQ